MKLPLMDSGLRQKDQDIGLLLTLRYTFMVYIGLDTVAFVFYNVSRKKNAI